MEEHILCNFFFKRKITCWKRVRVYCPVTAFFLLMIIKQVQITRGMFINSHVLSV